MSDRPQHRFQVGGRLREDAFYIEREADRELPDLLRNGVTCNVFAPRQSGKSSLVARTLRSLRDNHGIQGTVIDLNGIGTQVTPEQWYFSLCEAVADGLHVDVDCDTWWEQQGGTAIVKRWGNFLSEVIATRHTRAVIVLDEIDVLLSLRDLADDFFASLRAFAQTESLKSITFCVVGVALPGDLMRDSSRTPFNIQKSVLLEDFTRDQVRAVASLLASTGCNAEAVFDAVMDWTSGHPYMTLRLLDAVHKQGNLDAESARPWIDARVEDYFLRDGRAADPALKYIEDQFSKDRSDDLRTKMLGLYEQILRGHQTTVADNVELNARLRLIGICAQIRASNTTIQRPRNRIISTVFDLHWVEACLSDRKYAFDVRRWEFSSRDPAWLARGPLLAGILSWARGRSDLTEAENAFIDASRNTEIDVQRGKARQRNVVIALLLALLTAVSIGYLIAVSSTRRAEGEARRARIAELRLAEERAQALRRAAEAVEAQRDAVNSSRLAAVESRRARAQAEIALQSSRLASQRGAELVRAISRARQQTIAARTAENQAQNLASALQIQRASDRALQEGNALESAKLILESVLSRRTAGMPDLPIVFDMIANSSLVRRSLPASVLSGHDGSVLRARFSKSELMIATASDDATVRVWNVSDQRTITVLRGHSGAVFDVAFSPDDSLLLTASDDQTTRIWSTESWQSTATFHENAGFLLGARFSPDGSLVLTYNLDGTVRVWDSHSGQLLHSMSTGFRGSLCAAFSNDGSRIVTSGVNETKLLDSRTGNVLLSVTAQRTRPHSVSFSPDDTMILIADLAGGARLYNSQSLQLINTLSVNQFGTDQAVFSPDGRMIATVTDDRIVRLWWVSSGALQFTLAGHLERVLDVAFLPSGNALVTVSADRVARVWNTNNGHLEATLQGHGGGITNIAIAQRHSYFGTSSHDGTVRLWDWRNSMSSSIIIAHNSSVRTVEFSPDSRQLVTGSEAGVSVVWDIASGQPVSTFRGHSARVIEARFSHDGRRVLSLGHDATARLWDVATARESVAIRSPTASIVSAGLSPDGRVIVTGDTLDGALWDAQTGRLLHRLHREQDSIWRAIFTPDGQHVVSTSASGAPLVWDVTTGTMIGVLCDPGPPVWALAFARSGTRLLALRADQRLSVLRWPSGTGVSSIQTQDGVQQAVFTPDGRGVVTLDGDRSVRTWDVESGQLKHEFRFDIGAPTHADISPDGRRLVVVGTASQVELRDIDSGTSIASLRGHQATVNYVAFSPDGSRLATGGDDGTVRVWSTDINRWIRDLCEGIFAVDITIAPRSSPAWAWCREIVASPQSVLLSSTPPTN